MVKIWESPKWKELMKKIREATTKSALALDKLDNPLVDPVLLQQTYNFLKNQLPQLTEQKGEDFYNLLEGLIRKVIPLVETHIQASKHIYKEFLLSSDAQKSEFIRKNNIEFLRKIIFCFEEPIDTETSLSDEEFRMLERLINAFSDRLKFNPNRYDLAVREDLIIAAFRKQTVISGSIPRVLTKIAKFAGLTTKKEPIYDVQTGNERIVTFYYFDSAFEQFLDELALIERGKNDKGQEVRFLSQAVPVELLYSFIQGWRAVNLEPDILGEYLINGICNLLAYTILLSLPEGNINISGDIQLSQALLADDVCHPSVIAISKTIAYIIYGDNWLAAIWDSPHKSKYHRSVRYVTVGNLIHIRQGTIVLNNNVMTQYVRNFVVRIGTQA